MKKTKFYLLIFICSLSLAEDQLPQCTKTFKFRKTDSTCGNFEEACVRQDDDCNEFKKFCEKCPSSNFTAAHLIEILKKNKNILSEVNLIRNDLKKNFESEKITSFFNQTGECNATRQLVLSSIIIILLVFIIILILVESRFKIITKGLENCTGKGTKKDYRNYKSQRYMIDNRHSEKEEMRQMMDSQIKAFINTIDLNFKTQFEDFNKLIEAKIEEKMNAFCNSTIAKIESMNNKSSGTSLLEVVEKSNKRKVPIKEVKPDASALMEKPDKKQPELPSEPPSNFLDEDDDKFFSIALPAVSDD